MSRVERLINLTATLLETERPLTRDEVRALADKVFDEIVSRLVQA